MGWPPPYGGQVFESKHKKHFFSETSDLEIWPFNGPPGGQKRTREVQSIWIDPARALERPLEQSYGRSCSKKPSKNQCFPVDFRPLRGPHGLSPRCFYRFLRRSMFPELTPVDGPRERPRTDPVDGPGDDPQERPRTGPEWPLEAAAQGWRRDRTRRTEQSGTTWKKQRTTTKKTQTHF